MLLLLGLKIPKGDNISTVQLQRGTGSTSWEGLGETHALTWRQQPSEEFGSKLPQSLLGADSLVCHKQPLSGTRRTEAGLQEVFPPGKRLRLHSLALSAGSGHVKPANSTQRPPLTPLLFASPARCSAVTSPRSSTLSTAWSSTQPWVVLPRAA